MNQADLRQKDIRFSSRTRAGTDQFKKSQMLRRAFLRLLKQLPENLLNDPDTQLLAQEADEHVFNIISDDLSREELRRHFQGLRVLPPDNGGALEAGHADCVRTLHHPEVLQRPDIPQVYVLSTSPAMDGIRTLQRELRRSCQLRAHQWVTPRERMRPGHGGETARPRNVYPGRRRTFLKGSTPCTAESFFLPPLALASIWASGSLISQAAAAEAPKSVRIPVSFSKMKAGGRPLWLDVERMDPGDVSSRWTCGCVWTSIRRPRAAILVKPKIRIIEDSMSGRRPILNSIELGGKSAPKSNEIHIVGKSDGLSHDDVFRPLGNGISIYSGVLFTRAGGRRHRGTARPICRRCGSRCSSVRIFRRVQCC